jgi:sugar phosphate permease
MITGNRSLKALDWLNIFLADVRYGIGAFFAVYLLTTRKWDPGEIGMLMAIPGLTAIAFQAPAGALIDESRHKRILVVVACLIVGMCSIGLTLITEKIFIYVVAIIMGIIITIYSPAISAITLGLVGNSGFPKRMGRNQTFNHAGNVVITILTGLAGYYISFESVFYIMSAMCLLSIVAVLFIRESEIDHALAREADKVDGKEKVLRLKSVLADKNIIFFTIAVVLFYLANGALFPLLGQKLAIGREGTSTLYTATGIVIAELVMIPVAALTGIKASRGNRKFIYAIAFMILPVRAFLYTVSDSPDFLLSVQTLDGAAAGISGVISVVMIADLTKGTGRFNVMQGAIATSVEAGEAVSHFGSGIIVKNYGYNAGFYTLSCVGVIAFFFFYFLVDETKNIRDKKLIKD